jgi:hypothetical protein
MTIEPKTSAEQRKIRFACIDGIARNDLPLANEIWLQDVYRAPWASREMMKLAALFVRYMSNAEALNVSLGEIEIACQISPDEVRKTLNGMKGFGAIDTFVCDRQQIQCALNLTLLQRIQVLETRHRYGMLAGGTPVWHKAETKWELGKAA